MPRIRFLQRLSAGIRVIDGPSHTFRSLILQTGWLFIYQYQLNWLTGHDKLTLYRSSKDVERLFCSICGCQFTYKNLKRDETSTAQGKNETIDIALGTLDEDILRSDESVVPMRYAWYSDILEWMKAILPSEDKVTSVTSK
jgi:hypothetical protein